jgi:predicted secreted protein
MATESIRVQHREPFQVVLREPAATGHRWRLTDAPAQVVVVGERYEAPAPGGPTGSAGRRIITLRATLRGNYRLTFQLARAWEARPVSEHHVDLEAV